MTGRKKQSTEAAVREIRRKTRRKFAPEEKIRIVLEGLRGEQSISELCRREGIAANLYYRWSKDFLEAGKKQLAGDTIREATSNEVKELRACLESTDKSPEFPPVDPAKPKYPGDIRLWQAPQRPERTRTRLNRLYNTHGYSDRLRTICAKDAHKLLAICISEGG